MPKQKQISTLVGIIIIIIAIVILFGGVFAWQYFATKNSAQIQGQTADWKTYTNSEYGFELKYPSDWIEMIPKSWSTEANLSIVFCGDSKNYCDSGLNEIDFIIFKTKIDPPDDAYYYLGSSADKKNFYYLYIDKTGNKDIFSQMISTFKFTK